MDIGLTLHIVYKQIFTTISWQVNNWWRANGSQPTWESSPSWAAQTAEWDSRLMLLVGWPWNPTGATVVLSCAHSGQEPSRHGSPSQKAHVGSSQVLLRWLALG